MASENGQQTSTLSGLRVLLVEDDFATSHALRLLLTRMGCKVEAVSTIAQAFSRLDAGPDWLVVDLMLPDGDGTSLIKKIRDEHMSTRVAVTTGSSDFAKLKKVRELAPDLFLFKPIDLDSLFKALGRD